MKITDRSPLHAVEAAAPLRSSRQPPQTERVSASGDVVEISARAREIEQLKEVIRKLPEVRQDRVTALREQLATGEYAIPAADVARSMRAHVRALTSPPRMRADEEQ